MDQGHKDRRLGESRVLVVDADASNAIAQILRPHASSLDQRVRLAPLPPPERYDVIIANYDELDAEERDVMIREYSGNTKPRMLLLSGGKCQREFAELFRTHTLTNLLAQNGEVDAEDLIVTVQKILKREIFGLEKYFRWGVETATMTLNSSSEKQALLESAQSYAEKLGVHPRLASQYCTVADEFLTNALYNAPCDAGGKPRWAHLSRLDTVVLEPGEEIELKFCSDGRRLGIAVTDPFGSLTQERLLDYLAKCFRKGDEQIDQKAGGAGLGLYQIFDAVSHLVTNISVGKRTEMIGIIDVHASYREFAKRNKSFNIFHDNLDLRAEP